MTAFRLPAIVMVFFLWFAGLGAAAQFAKVSIIFADLQSYYGEDGPLSGFLLSIISLLGIFFGLSAGLIGARLGYRRLLVAGLLLGGAASFAQMILPPFWIMLALRLLEGAAHLAIVVATPTLIAEIAPANLRGFAMTLWGTFFGVAFAVVSLIAPPLLDIGGLPAIFAAHGAFMLIMGVLMFVLLPPEKTTTIAKPNETTPGYVQAHIEAYRSPFICAPAVAWTFYTLTFVSLITVLPQFVPEDERLWLIALMPIASIISSMTLGVFLLRFTTGVGVVVFGFILSAIISAMMLFFGVQSSLGIALFAALGLVQGASFAAVPQLNPSQDDRGRANGLLAQTGNLGNTLGTPLMVLIIGFAGQSGMMVFSIMCYLVAMFAHLSLANLRRRQLAAGAM